MIKGETFGPVGSVKYREYAKDINESGQHLLDLINDILDLSKIESGMEELHEENVDIAETISSVHTLVKERAHRQGVRLAFDMPDVPPRLRADRRKLKQILVNILANGIKYTEPDGEVTLRVWCDETGGYLFQIRDSGQGIKPEDIPKALSTFGQIYNEANRQRKGTGLGLPLSKSLIELHGGSLDLQSEVGVGTTVTIRFPAARIVPSARHASNRLASN